MKRFAWICSLLVVLSASAASAATIIAESKTLLANTPNQDVRITLQPGDAVENLIGLDFAAVLETTAPNPPVDPQDPDGPSLAKGPVFDVPVDLLVAGTIWGDAGGADTPGARIDLPRVQAASAITQAGDTVQAPGLIATLKIDTTGLIVPAGQTATYRLILDDPTFQSSSLDDTGNNAITSFQNGTLTIVGPPIPEPSTLVLMGMAMVGVMGYGLRRRSLSR